MNAFQADASEVKINFTIAKEKEQITGYTIEDNGLGFTNANIDSFLTLWSDYNIKKGALGSGRILCLKVFSNMEITSQTKDTDNEKGRKVVINFHKEFDANTIDDIGPTENSANSSFTITKFKNLHKDYQDKIEIFDQKNVQNKIFIKLLPLFIKFNDESKSFSLTINGLPWLNSQNIEEEFLGHHFHKKQFCIKTSSPVGDHINNIEEEKFDFTLLYRITKDNDVQLEQFYGASGRNITSFSKGAIIGNLDKGYSGIFCLTSSYFDTRVKDSRSAFIIPANQNNATKENPITFKEINNQLIILLNEIWTKHFPQANEKLTGLKDKVIDKHPHLAPHINKITNLTISESQIFEQAEKSYTKQNKDARDGIAKLTEAIKKHARFDQEKFTEATKNFTTSGQEQLAQYIGYRQMIIELLLNVHEHNTNNATDLYNEQYIHDLIMPKGHVKQNNEHPVTENNFWLFDDKFMSFSYAASDIEINKIINSLSLEMDDETKDYFASDRPDLLMLYSNEYKEEKDVVIIELKKINIGSYDRSKAIDQLNTYASIIQETIPAVNDVFVYAVFDFDHKLEKILSNRGFHPKAFSKDGHKLSSFYMYNANNRAHVHALSFHHLILDANLRNKLFLSILKNETPPEK